MNNSISYLKAFAILAMVLAHACDGADVNNYIVMFHMPAFIFASGFCLKEAYLCNTKVFITKRVKGLYFPFIKWNFLFLLFHNVFYNLHIYNSSYGFTDGGDVSFGFQDFIRRTGELLLFRRSEVLVGGFWFLHALFYGSVIAFILLLICKKQKWQPVVALMGSVAMLVISDYYVFSIDWLTFNSQCFASAVIFLGGYIFAYYNIKPFNLYLCIISFIILVLGRFYWCTALAEPTYSNRIILPYIVTACLASWAFYSLFDRIKDNGGIVSRIFLFIGNNTLQILLWHFLMFRLVSLLIVYVYDMDIKHIGEHPVIKEHPEWWVLYFIVGVVFSLLPTFTVNKVYEYIKK